jgi:hypothetical protein
MKTAHPPVKGLDLISAKGEFNLITIVADLEMDSKDLICRSVTLT